MRAIGSYVTIWKMGIGDGTLTPSNVTIRHYIGHMRGIEAYACMIHPLPDEVFAPHNPLLPTDQSEESHAPRKLSSIAQLFRAQVTHWTLRKWTWFKLLPNLACLHLDVFVGDKMLKKLQNVKTKSQYQNQGGNVGPTFYFFGLGNLTSTKLVLSIDGGSFNCCCQRMTECSIVFSCLFRSAVTTVNKNAWKGQPLKTCVKCKPFICIAVLLARVGFGGGKFQPGTMNRMEI